MEHVNHSDHYQLNGMEAIDIIAAMSKEHSGVASFDWYLNHLLSLNDKKDIFVKEYDTNENR